MRATLQRDSSKMENNRILKKKSHREHAANNQQLVLGTGQAERCGGWLHYLVSGRTASAPKPENAFLCWKAFSPFPKTSTLC